ncbi:MAG: hypothetical protein PHH31_02265 [Acidaminococcaceae bacterium]|nr:hypothetical protein [Acidaminococcaceae bacterium]
MILFPYGKVVLVTEKEKTQVVQILRDNLRKKAILQTLFTRCDESCAGYLNGSVRRTNFKITTIRCGSNTFKPIFKGILKTENDKTVIVIKARLNIVIIGFIVVWFEFYGRLIFSDFTNVANWGGKAIILPIFVTLLLYGAIDYFFWKEFKAFKEQICALLDAEPIK